MKKLFRFLILSLFLATGLSAISCSDDNKVTYDNSIIGTWEQINSAGTVITLQFNPDKTGTVKFAYPDGGYKIESLEYDYLPEERDLEIVVGPEDLLGYYDVILSATKLRLEGYRYVDNMHVAYQFTRK